MARATATATRMVLFIALSVRLKADTTIRPAEAGHYDLFRGCVALTSAAQNVFQRVVRLVAGVLENLFVRGRPRELSGERRHPGARVLDGEAIQERVVGHTREALDHMQILT